MVMNADSGIRLLGFLFIFYWLGDSVGLLRLL